MPPKRKPKATQPKRKPKATQPELEPEPESEPGYPSPAHMNQISMMETPNPRKRPTRLPEFDDRSEQIRHLRENFFPELQKSNRIPGDPYNGYLWYIKDHIWKHHTNCRNPYSALQQYFSDIDMEKFRLYGPELKSPDQLKSEGIPHVIPSPLEYEQRCRLNKGEGNPMISISPSVSTPRPKDSSKRKSGRKKKTRRGKKKGKQTRRKKRR